MNPIPPTPPIRHADLPGDQQPRAPEGTGAVAIGTPLPRIDALLKVTGRARYAAEHGAAPLLHGVIVDTAVPRGRIRHIDTRAALALPGVVEVMTHENRPRMRPLDLFYKDMTAPAGSPFRPLYDDQVHHSGQPVALVLATSFEVARHAARLLRVEVDPEPHQTGLLAHLDRAREPGGLRMGFTPPPKPRGDADAALAAAPHQVDATFHHEAEHHHPMELFATTVLYGADGHLTVHDKTQGSQNARWVVSRALGVPKRRVTVLNAFVGGAFGSGLRPQANLLLACMAALKLKQSVRVVMTRQQMSGFGHRPQTWQRLRLGADHQGRLTAVIHEARAETSRREDHADVVVNWSAQLYVCPNARVDYQLVELDRHSPADMRAPGAAVGVFALEVAMDELAHAAGLDPLALRLINHADVDASNALPYSSKALRDCYEQGAAAFGWAGRAPQPRARREGHEWVGWGMATGIWDAMQLFARVRAVLGADGHLLLESAASDIGTGTYTVMSQIAAAELGLPLEQVAFRLGDSNLPSAPVEGGSSHVASVGSAVLGVCAKLKRELLRLARAHAAGFEDARPDQVAFQGGELRRPGTCASVPLGRLLLAGGVPQLEANYLLLPNLLKQRRYARATHSAVFAEVRVDEQLGMVRVTRVVSAVAAGRIINPVTARSQIIGGVVWGLGQALHEAALEDAALGRFMNHSLSEYHLPVNADVPPVQVLFVEEHDEVAGGPLGAKGVGEIGIVGVAAAVANAIFHATGRRLHQLPMTPDRVMTPGPGAQPAGPVRSWTGS